MIISSKTMTALVVAICLLWCDNLSADNSPALTSYKQGAAAEAHDDIESAYEFYYRAFERNPTDMRFKTSYERMRPLAASIHTRRGEGLQTKGEIKAAMVEYLRALAIDASNDRARQDMRKAQESSDSPAPAQRETSLLASSQQALKRLRSSVELKPLSSEPLTLHLEEDSKSIYEALGKAAGLNILFDPDYAGKRIKVDLVGVSILDSLRIVSTLSGTFWRPVTSNTLFVAQSSRAKRTELEQLGVQTFYLSNASQQNDFTDIQTAIRNLLPNAKTFGVASQAAIVMRATPDELLLTQKLIDDLDKAKPEVVVDVAVLEVSRDKLKNIGIQLPQTGSVSLQASTASSSSSTTSSTTSTSTSDLTLNTLAHLNASNFAVTLGQAQAELLLTDTDTKVLQNPRVRATDGQDASLKIGSRIPYATGTYTASTSSSSSGTQTQFQYVDVGVNINLKPTIHYDQDVTLKLKIEISSQTGSTVISGVTEPIISQRVMEETIRLKEGEVNIVGGLLQRNETVTISGTPGLGEVPILKYLFSTQEHEVVNDEIVFLLMPHVVRGTELTPTNLKEVDSGTGNSIALQSADVLNPVTTGQLAGVSDSLAKPGTTSPLAYSSDAAMPVVPSTARNASLLVSAVGQGHVGKELQVALSVVDGKEIFSLPMQIHYDTARLTLEGVDTGDFLRNDGQTVALQYQEDGNGEITIIASRPPGAAGVTGTGQVCVLKFKARTSGDTIISSGVSMARNSQDGILRLPETQTAIHVQPIGD